MRFHGFDKEVGKISGRWFWFCWRAFDPGFEFFFEEDHVFTDFAGFDAAFGDPVAEGSGGDFQVSGCFFVVHGLYVEPLLVTSD